MDLTLIPDKNIEKKLKIKTKVITILESKHLKLLNKKINKAKGPVIVKGNETLNRKILENKKVDILIPGEEKVKKDFLYARNSALNHILAKIAKSNNITIAFSFSTLLNAIDSFGLANILGRMRQNVKLCRKYKVKMIIASFAKNKYELRDKVALKSFGYCLGMNGSEIKKALSYS